MLSIASITAIYAREILDSRGNPTVEAEVHAGKVVGIASVPSGATTGKHEAVELRDGGKRFLGLGVQKAVRNIENIIAPKIQGMDCQDQEKIDSVMIRLDGTSNKTKLGANAILAVSLACAKAAAHSQKKELWQYLHQLSRIKQKPSLPQPFFNVINGNKHAGNHLAIQEFFIVPRGKSFSESLRIGTEVYHTLKKILREEYGVAAINVGDEGGFAPPLKRTEEALKLLLQAITLPGYMGRVSLGLDCAASEFFSQGKYTIDGKGLSSSELLKYYLALLKTYPILSLEDPFEQEDFASFAKLRKKSGIQVVGDDLVVTNVRRVRTAIKDNSISCVLLKPNQIGTLTETLDVVRLAYQNNLKVMVSHRSGETEDTFIADLAVGIGCGMIKAGAPCRGERTVKYNRLLRIEGMWK